jgi:hypothetical protein
MRPIIVNRTLTTDDADGICLSQTPGAGGNLILNGVFVTGGVATLDAGRVVGITSAANDSARTFVVYGTNDQGFTQTETVTPGPNIGTVSTVLNFKTVTRITIDAASAGALTIGTTAIGSSAVVPIDQYDDPTSVGLFLEFTGTVNVTVQYTGSDIWAANATTTSTAIVWTDHPNLTSKAATSDSNLAYPSGGVRLKTNSGTGTCRFIVRQAGPM